MGETAGTAGYNGYPGTDGRQAIPEDGLPTAFAGNPLPVSVHDNLYFNGAKPCEQEQGAVEATGFQAEVRVVCEEGAWYLETNLPAWSFTQALPIVTTESLGRSFQAEAAYENADGTPLRLDRDFCGWSRKGQSLPGPFAILRARIPLDPCKKGER